MNLTRRCVLSFQNETSDKIYILELFAVPVKDASVNADPPTRNATLIASWGRRTAPRLSSQVKHENVLNILCSRDFEKIRRTKRRAGYIEVGEDMLETFSIPGYQRKDMHLQTNSLVNASRAQYDIPKDLPVAEEVRTII